ncbi:PEP-utilizing enzyme [Arthrobacter sp. ISL-72]|uniref:PEP-utilizing enzyme n=1 Tax=Arthrobacter sp. ISL-72 TaxID=2819114 RepID=UPI00203581C9|nr:PEP-utilizing enzyme [Arthrobacter sp. ISL-72]
MDVSKNVLTGTGASPGIACGTARTVQSIDQFSDLRPGEVLVCRTTDPAWTPLFAVASAVITETGGMLSHAAIVAREYGIPAVLGLNHALTRITTGTSLVVDGTHGTVRENPATAGATSS